MIDLFLKKIFGSKNDRELKRMAQAQEADLEAVFLKLTEEKNFP